MTDRDDAARLHPPGIRSLSGSLEILRALVVKDLKVKYKRSILGFFWSLATPLALTAVYTFVFVYVYKRGSDGFIFFLMSGLLPWHYFNISILAATNSFVENASVLRKVYFPKVLIPAATIFANLINLLVALGLITIGVLLSGRPILPYLPWVIVAIVLETALLMGISIILAVGNVYFRDIGQMISIIIMVLFFATPIVYDASLVPPAFKFLIYVNPLATVMDLFRAGLFNARLPDMTLLATGTAEIALIGLIAFFAYRRLGPSIAKEL